VEVDEVDGHAGEKREETGGKEPKSRVEKEGEGDDLGRGSAAGSRIGQKG
jgi:hypothetical protein